MSVVLRPLTVGFVGGLGALPSNLQRTLSRLTIGIRTQQISLTARLAVFHPVVLRAVEPAGIRVGVGHRALQFCGAGKPRGGVSCRSAACSWGMGSRQDTRT